MPLGTGFQLGTGTRIRTGTTVITTGITTIIKVNERGSAARRIDRPLLMPMGKAPAGTGASSFIVLSRGLYCNLHSRHRDTGHLEGNVTPLANDLRANLDQLLAQPQQL
jgi:hypothetical protein